MAIHTTVKCTGGWIERPLEEEGDASHKIYRLNCLVDAGSYSLTALGPSTTMSSASAAEINELPGGISADSSAYFVGDSTPHPVENTPFVRFVRSFATVPASHTRVENTVTYTFPEYREWYDFGSSDQGKADINVAALPTPPILLKKARTLAVPAKVTYTYYYRIDGGVGIALDETYRLLQRAQNDTGQMYTLDEPEVVGVGYVCDTDTNGTLTLYGTYIDTAGSEKYDGDLSGYQTYVTNGIYLTISSTIGHYMGNIYYKRKVEVVAQ